MLIEIPVPLLDAESICLWMAPDPETVKQVLKCDVVRYLLNTNYITMVKPCPVCPELLCEIYMQNKNPILCKMEWEVLAAMLAGK